MLKSGREGVMFVGHLGAGLAARAVARDINLGAAIAAALLLDAVLWLAVLAGWERMIVPPDYAQKHFLLFDFPFSHSLVAALLWAALAALLWSAAARRKLLSLGAGVMALAVLSHWLLDFLVHEPDLTLWGNASPRLGLGLWNRLDLALLAEMAIAGAGLAWFLMRVKLTSARVLTVIAMTLVIAALTYAGMQSPTPPPGATLPAITSLLAIAMIVAVSMWADKSR